MKTIVKHILVAGALAIAAQATAQNTKTGYFLDDYTYRYKMNPAMANSKGFVSFPALGNMNLGVSGTLGISDVLYNVNGRTTTFLNPSLSASEVLGKFKDNNKFGLDLNMPIIAVGFKALNGYNTVTVGMNVSTGIKLPGSIFTLLKEGISNKTYDIGNIDAYARAYAEIALNHSHKLNDQFTVGASLKFLVGAGDIAVNMKKAQLELTPDDWRIVADGTVNASLDGFKYKTDINENTHHRYVSDVDFDDVSGPGGYGVAVDLGVVYTPKFLEGLEISAAVTDLGGISWSNDMLATTNGEKVFNTDRYTFNVSDDAPNSFDNEFDKLKDDFSALYELEDAGDQGSRFTMLAATTNVGVKYTLPMYKPVAFGLLNTTRINGDFTWTDFRLSANYAPCSIFDLAVSASMGTYGFGWGWLLNLHCTGFNLFFGADRMAGKLSKEGAPLNSNMVVNFGLNFLF